MNAKELKNEGEILKLGGKEYNLKLDLNSFCELEDLYGKADQVLEGIQTGSFKVLRAVAYTAIKEIDEKVTLKEVGAMIGFGDIEKVSQVVHQVLKKSMPEAGDNKEVKE